MKADLVVFGEDWGRHPSSTQHLVGRLAADRRILWINSIGMRRPRLTLRDVGRAARKASAAIWPHRQSATPPRMPDGVSLASPLVVPWPGQPLATAINARLLRSQIGAHLRRRSFHRPIFWTSLPTALPAVGGLGERAVVYYCGDDFGALAGVDHAPVVDMERDLVVRADLVIAASEALAARFPRHKTLLLPHGADVEMFARALTPAPDLPLDRPTAGFYGSISDWIDVDLIARSARRLPSWDFILIGAVATDVRLLRALPNVRLLGPREHSDLARYAQHWTASMLPFRDCAQIRACNPLKLREYLAAGRPVVSTPFPAVDEYAGHVSIATTADGFAEKLVAALHEPAHAIAARRRRVALETWEVRAAELDTVLARLD